MVLIRLIVLKCLIHNVCVFARHVVSEENEIADSLSRFQMKHFYTLTKNLEMDRYQTEIPEDIWLLTKIWEE